MAVESAKMIATAKGLDLESVLIAVGNNTRQLYGIVGGNHAVVQHQQQQQQKSKKKADKTAKKKKKRAALKAKRKAKKKAKQQQQVVAANPGDLRAKIGNKSGGGVNFNFFF